MHFGAALMSSLPFRAAHQLSRACGINYQELVESTIKSLWNQLSRACGISYQELVEFYPNLNIIQKYLYLKLSITH